MNVTTGTRDRVRRRVAAQAGEPLRIVIVRPPFPWRRTFQGVAILCVVCAGGWLAYTLSEILIMLAVAGLLAFILDPLVVALQRKVPRWAAIIVAYLGLVTLVALLALNFTPRIVSQVQSLQAHYPQLQRRVSSYTDRFKAWHDALPPETRQEIENARLKVSEYGKKMLGTLLTTVLTGLGWLGRGVIMLVLSIYLLIDKDRLQTGLLGLIPVNARDEILSVSGEVLSVLRGYLRGQIVVIGFVAVSVTSLLFVFKMPYALTIGTVAGIMEVIPYFGAVVGAIPAVLYTFIEHGWFLGSMMVFFFVVLNQFEGHVVIPFVMGRNLEMRPLAVLLALLVGHQLGGIVGLIVAVPVARILQVLVEHGIHIYRNLEDALGSDRGLAGDAEVSVPAEGVLLRSASVRESSASDVAGDGASSTRESSTSDVAGDGASSARESSASGVAGDGASSTLESSASDVAGEPPRIQVAPLSAPDEFTATGRV